MDVDWELATCGAGINFKFKLADVVEKLVPNGEGPYRVIGLKLVGGVNIRSLVTLKAEVAQDEDLIKTDKEIADIDY